MIKELLGTYLSEKLHWNNGDDNRTTIKKTLQFIVKRLEVNFLDDDDLLFGNARTGGKPFVDSAKELLDMIDTAEDDNDLFVVSVLANSLLIRIREIENDKYLKIRHFIRKIELSKIKLEGFKDDSDDLEDYLKLYAKAQDDFRDSRFCVGRNEFAESIARQYLSEKDAQRETAETKKTLDDAVKARDEAYADYKYFERKYRDSLNAIDALSDKYLNVSKATEIYYNEIGNIAENKAIKTHTILPDIQTFRKRLSRLMEECPSLPDGKAKCYTTSALAVEITKLEHDYSWERNTNFSSYDKEKWKSILERFGETKEQLLVKHRTN